MGEATYPIPAGLQGVVVPSEIDGHAVAIALARRGDRGVEAILRDGALELRAKADLLLDQYVPVLDVLMGSLIKQWRAANPEAADVWALMRGE